MTDEQKFLFDLNGWLLFPGVLAGERLADIRRHVLEGGDGFTGPAQELLDHPLVADVLSEIIGGGPCPEDHYDFRCENSFRTVREAGYQPGQGPHCEYSLRVSSYRTNGRFIQSGLTRVVWELNPVNDGDGGTYFLSGSHKAAFPKPESLCRLPNDYMESYSCPAGSMLVFTETLWHSGAPWTNAETPRAALFYCYNAVNAQFHKLNLPAGRVRSMPPKRQTLFRGVWLQDFTVQPRVAGRNIYYSPQNEAL